MDSRYHPCLTLSCPLRSDMSTEAADEIDLRTLLLILRKHFRLFIIITVIVTIVGSIWSLRRPQQYSYRQSIQLANYYVNGKLQFLQPAVEIEQLINNVYLSAFQQRYNQQNPMKKIAIIGPQINAEKNVNRHYRIVASNNSDVLFIQGYGDKQFVNIFTRVNEFIFQKIIQEQKPLKEELSRHLQTKISIFINQIPELEKLQRAKNNYIINMQNGNNAVSSKDSFAQISHDIYINSLGAQANQNNLISLKINLADLKQQLSSIVPLSLNEMSVTVKLTRVSNLMKIMLSFFVGIFLAGVIVFFRNVLNKMLGHGE